MKNKKGFTIIEIIICISFTLLQSLKKNRFVVTIDEKEVSVSSTTELAKTVDDVTNYVKAGGACGHCKNAIKSILNEELVTKKELKEENSKLNPTQKILKINNVIETSIVPLLQKDGGDIEFIDYDNENNVVTVKLKGRCSACKNALLTLKNLVETTLKEHVDKNIQVKQG